MTTVHGTTKSLAGYQKLIEGTDRDYPFIFYVTEDHLGILSMKYGEFDPILVTSEYFLKK